MWAWCSGGCARWYYLRDKSEPSCPVCLSLPTAYTAEDPGVQEEAERAAARGPRASGHCPRCSQWFLVQDPAMDTHFLCPVCLIRADDVRWQTVGEAGQTA